MNSALIEPLEARIAPATLTIAPAQVLEGDLDTTTKLIFTVTLSGPSQEMVTVRFATEDGTAEYKEASESDYLATEGTLSFAPGETTKTIEVTVFGDNTGEEDETLFVRLSEPTGGATIGTEVATGTILNDGIHIIGQTSFLEGDEDHTITFTVLRETVDSSPLTIHYTTVDGTATLDDNDYGKAEGTLNFGVGEAGSTATFTVDIKGDRKGEEDETFQIVMTDVDHNPIGTPTTITILNDGLHIRSSSIMEGDSGLTALTFEVIRETLDLGPATVKYMTVDGTATVTGRDYQQTNGLLTFAQDETEKQITVNIIGDLNGEDDETFLVKLFDATGTTITQGEATGTILNDTKIRVSSVSVLEGDSPDEEGSRYLEFVVTLEEASGEVTVGYSTQDGEAGEGFNAIAGEDYVAANGVLTFLSGETSQTVRVRVIGDLIGENDEQLLFNLFDPSPGATIVTPQATGTILNDVKFSFSVLDEQTSRDPSKREGDSGISYLKFGVQAQEAAPGGSTVNYATSNFTNTNVNAALAGEDYVATSGTLTFTVDNEPQEVHVAIKGDYKFEPDEKFLLSLTTPGKTDGPVATATGTILSDDKLTISNVQIIEGNSGVKKAIFTVLLDEPVPSGKQYRVDYTTVDDTAKGIAAGNTGVGDYRITSGTLKIAAGQRTGTIEVEIFGDLNYEEASEFFKVRLENARIVNANDTSEGEDSATDVENFATREGIGTIIDGADTPPTIRISDSRFLEGSGGGTKQAEFTLTLSEATDFDVTVKLSTILGTGAGAADANDFTPFADRVVVIPAGQKTVTFTVDIAQDDLDEGDETFSVRINEATLLLPSQTTPLQLTKTRDTAVGTIVNDEISVTVEPVEITEGDTGTKEMVFLVKLSGATTRDVTINYTLEDLTAIFGKDYKLAGSGNTGSVVIPAGSTQAEIKVLIVGDEINEGALHDEPDINKEKFKLKLTSATNAQLGTDGSNALTVTGTIVDNDGTLVEGNESKPDILLPTVTLETVRGQTVEGGQLEFKVVLSHASDHDIEIPYSVVNGTAVSGSDFTGGSNLKVFIPAGETKATIIVNTTDDSTIEASETFSVKLGTLGAKDTVLLAPELGGKSELTATILDNEAKPTLSISDVVIVEGGPGEGKKAVFKVRLSAVSTENIQVNYQTIDGTAVSVGADADYTATIGTLTIEAGKMEGTIEVPIIGDSIIEGDETFFVRLSSPSGATIAVNQAKGTIANDETRFKILFLQEDGTFAETRQVNEGDKGTSQKIKFKIVREGDLGAASSVRFVTAAAGNEAGDIFRDASSDGPRVDYVHRSEVVNFAENIAESGVYEITINGDDHYEGTEEFFVRLVDTFNGSPSSENPDMGKVQILDNEERPTITFERTLVEVREGGLVANTSTQQKTAMTFRIKLSHVDETGTVTMKAVAEAVEMAGLTKAMASGTKADFELPSSSTISFAPGETEKTYTLTVLGDLRDEHDETIRVTLSDLDGGGAYFSDGSEDSSEEAPNEISALGKIIDDDAEARVYISDLVKKDGNSYIGVTYAETDGAGTDKIFRVWLEGQTDKIVTVKYHTNNGTAVAGADFIGISEAEAITITFDPEASSSTARTEHVIYVPVINDDVVEGNESFQVKLTDLTNATAGDDKTGYATITDNDTPIVSIEDMEIVESGSSSGILKAKFIVRLAAPAERDVVVNFTTEDGTAKSSGVFADYIAKQGSITFAPGEVVKEIEIDIIDDNYLEGHAVKNSNNQWELVHNESFKVKLSGSGLTIARGTATGTILNGPEDTITGIGISDTHVVEDQTEVVGGETRNVPARFAVELSIPSLSNTVVNVGLRSGTATKGVDFQDLSDSASKVTINVGQTLATFDVDVINDRQFENTEHFFADLSNVPTDVQIVKSGRGTIYNDDVRLVNARTVQWIDVDGDLVTLKVSKGTLRDGNFGWLTDSSGNIYVSPVGGLVLNTLNLFSSEFQNANVTITAERQPGFGGDPNGVLGDGRVNVGFIMAGALDPGGVSSNGVDLGVVKIDGDLSRIDAGDRYLDTPAVRKLQVFSLAMQAEEVGMITRDNEGNVTGANIQSNLQGPVGKIDVRTDFAGSIHVKGGAFGDVKSLKIGGALWGSEFAQSGTFIFSGTLQKAVVGEILGGTGNLSGRIEGDSTAAGNIGSIVVKGDIMGSGDGSGVIAASSIRKASVGRILGGIGDDSGQIRAGVLYNVAVKGDVVGGAGDRSGAILTDKNTFGGGVIAGVGTVKIGGRLIGAQGIQSGMVKSEGGFGGITIGGNLPTGNDAVLPEITAAVTGGTGTASGSIQSSGEIWKLKVTGRNPDGQGVPVSLQGGAGSDSGIVSAGGIKNAQLVGGIIGGSGQRSGTIFSAGSIGTLKVTAFDPDGNAPESAVSLQGGTGVGSGTIQAQGAIKKLTLVGDVVGEAAQTGEILAGSIGNLRIDGDLLGGSGSESGVIEVGGKIKSLVVGNVKGGSAFATGAIAAGSIGKARIHGDLEGSSESTTGLVRVAGEIKSLVIGGNLKGGSSKEQNEEESVDSTLDSGAITAGKIGTLRILGDVTSGQDLGAGLAGSGSIGVQGPIGTLEIRGSILGNSDVPVKILAFGDTKAAAIGKLLVGGGQGADSVEYAEITAGVSIRSTQQGYFPVNADAKIGLVRIDGDVKGLNITAGVNTGEDGKFATADDQVLNHPIAQINDQKVYSSIARVIINGTIQAVEGEGDDEILPYGIVAQHIGKVSYKVGGILHHAPLQKGAGNDRNLGAGETIPGFHIKPNGEDTGFRVIEVPIA